MKAIIDGKRYDTDTASCEHEWDNGRLPGDFHLLEKTLYRTSKGAWFLHISGGALTEMARPCSGGTTGSEEIRPLSDEEAREFLEETGGLEALEKFFDDLIEDA